MVTWHKWVMAGNKQDGTPLYYGEGECLSADTKPTDVIFNGSQLIEIDTATDFRYDAAGKRWLAQGSGSGGGDEWEDEDDELTTDSEWEDGP